jgi:type II secretory pathway pseudopilin PulG
MPREIEGKAQGGFTIIESAVALSILALSLLALWGTLIYCSRSNLASEQKKRAINAAQAKVEELKSRPFPGLIGEYGPGGTVGDTFTVPDLDDEETVAHGKIAFFVDETDDTGDKHLGLPLDLNGDGDATDTDVSDDYILLPVQVSVTWQGALGEQTVSLRSILRRGD